MESNQNNLPQELIQQFIQITNTDEYTARIFLTDLDSNITLQQAIQQYFNMSEDEESEEEEENDPFINTAVNDIMNIIQTRPAIREYINSGRIDDLMTLFQDGFEEVTRYEYPETIDQYTTQMLYTWGKNKPHYCVVCCSKAFITYIKVKNSENYNILRLIPNQIIDHNKIDSHEKKNKLINDILQNIDKFYDDICNHVIKYFDTVYEKYEEAAKTNVDNPGLSNNTQRVFVDRNHFLNELQFNFSRPYRIIWEALHQNDLSKKIPKSDRRKELDNLVKSETFVQFITNEWEVKTYNHPASEKAIAGLRHEKLIDQNKIIELNLANENCAICLEKFKVGTEVTILKCHAFCKECIMPWLSQHNNTCPVCRKCIDDEVKCPPAPSVSQTLPTVPNNSD